MTPTMRALIMVAASILCLGPIPLTAGTITAAPGPQVDGRAGAVPALKPE